MTLAIFDLDNTLIAGDSDHLWGEFIIAQGLVEEESYRRQNDAFYAAYQNGTLDINAYLEFALRPIAGRPLDELDELHQRFMASSIAPIVLAKARALVDDHRQRGHRLLIITATNRFITGPIARVFGIDEMLASEPELRDGRYTGKATGVPCFQHGKVTRLRAWLGQTGVDAEDSYFYTDSFNDVPLLEQVAHPVAVDPDERLADYARGRGLDIISLR